VDKWLVGNNRNEYIYFLEVIESLGVFMGVIGVEFPRKTEFMSIIIGYIGILYMSAVEIRSTYWCENRMNYIFEYVPPQIKPIQKKPIEPNEKVETSEKIANNDQILQKEPEIMPIIKSVTNESEKTIKYKLLIKMILKTLLEYFIAGSFLFAAAGKNNILELAFIPVAALCAMMPLTLKKSWLLSLYMWFWLFVQYFMCVTNMMDNSVPQTIDDSIFIRAFKLPKWPIYKIILTGWHPKNDWAYYFAIGNTSTTRLTLIIDVIMIFLQVLYFQNFCHSFCNLSSDNLNTVDDNLSFAASQTNINIGSPLKEKDNESIISAKYKTEHEKVNLILSSIYTFLKQALFVYSHILTLFLLIVLGAFSEGAITIFYICFAALFIQFDLFTSIGTKGWQLPKFIKNLLKPYIFFDLVIQFIYQYPSLRNMNSELFPYIGIEDVRKNAISIWVKTIIFTVVIYQDAIYSSKQYQTICESERKRIKQEQKEKQKYTKFVYNNKRIYEFRRQKYILTENRTQLAQVEGVINSWNEVLHRKEIKNNQNESQAESGMRLDIQDSKQRLEKMERKLKNVDEYPYLAFKNCGLIDKIYIWLFNAVNHILFMTKKEINEQKENIKNGKELQNFVTEYYVKFYKDVKKAKIEIEKCKLKILEDKLLLAQQISKDSNKEDQTKKLEDFEAELPKIPEAEGLPKIKLIIEIIKLLFKLIYSNSECICYLLIIIAEIAYGNILSLIYVASVFCYALLVRGRPHPKYWKFLRIYSGIILVLKYICSYFQWLLIFYVKGPSNNKNYWSDFFAKFQQNVFFSLIKKCQKVGVENWII